MMVHEALSSTIPTTTIKHGYENCVSSSRSQQDPTGQVCPSPLMDEE
jgi:hypothetical protein